MLRVACYVLACCGLAGCNPTIRFFEWHPYDAGTAPCVPGTEPAPERACDAPTALSADDVVDVHTFRTVASAVVCDWSLRCGFGFGFEQYCHPGYAEWEAASSEPSSFDLDAARACVRAVVAGSCDEALFAAYACHEISLHGACLDCALTCEGCGAAREGDPCDPAASTPTCDSWLFCSAEGRCAPAPPSVCNGVTIEPPGHFGCPCTTDDACPLQTGACVAGRCVERPFAGSPCGPEVGECFESVCDHARCRALETGEGYCSADQSCAPGLVCGVTPGWFARGSHRCGTPIPSGAACGEGIAGRCADGLQCRDGLCAPL